LPDHQLWKHYQQKLSAKRKNKAKGAAYMGAISTFHKLALPRYKPARKSKSQNWCQE